MVEVSYSQNFNLAIFWWYRFYSENLYKNLDVDFIVVELILKNFSSHFVSVPIKRRFDIRALLNGYSSEKIEWTSTGKSREDQKLYFFQ